MLRARTKIARSISVFSQAGKQSQPEKPHAPQPVHRPKRHRERQRLWLPLCGIGYMAGLFIGGGTLSAEQDGFFSLFAKQYITLHLYQPAAGVWKMDFLSALCMLGALLFCAFCCVGAPLALLVPVLRGICSGVLAGWLYMELGGAGIAMNSLIFWLPGGCISAVLVIFAGYSVQTSLQLGRQLTGMQTAASAAGSLQALLHRFWLYALVILGLCMLQAAFTALFGPLFR